MRLKYIHASSLPEIKNALNRYAVPLRNKPHYVVVGYIEMEGVRSFGGPIGFTDHEFYAKIIKKTVAKYGYATVERTEFHPDGATFHVGDYWKNLDRKVRRTCR